MALTTRAFDFPGKPATGHELNNEFDRCDANAQDLESRKLDKTGGTITGPLTVEGPFTAKNPTLIETEDLNIKDNEITLNVGESGAGITLGTSGVRIKRGSLADALLRFVEADGRFKVGLEGALETIAYLADVYTRSQLDGFFEGEASGKKQVDWARVLNKPVIEAQRIANASGTADAISATFTPTVSSLTNGLTVYVRATAANTASGVVFQADATSAKPVVKGANRALEIGDIAGAGHWLELQFDSAIDKWVMQNPARSPAMNASGAAPIYACRAWVSFNGSTIPPTIIAAGNVSSVVRNSTGDYTVNFATPMPDAAYDAIVIVSSDDTGTSGSFGNGVRQWRSGEYLQGSFRFTAATGQAISDFTRINIAVFR